MPRILLCTLMALALAACDDVPSTSTVAGSASGTSGSSASGSSSGSTTGTGSTSGSSSSSSSSATSTGGSSSTSTGGSTSGSSCPLAANTTPTSTVTNGCALLDRDTSACRASRQAQGLSGAWLQFSCRVTLTVTTAAGGRSVVQLSSDSRPDYESNYFPTSDACYVPYTPAFPDPNTIAAQSLVVRAPTSPDTTAQAMGLGPVGMALNGVALFDNQAAPGDDIYKESGSFDECQGHPQQQGMYHYHSEPYALSSDDARLLGVLRDGYFVYGRRDADGSVPTDLDAAGGHVGTTPDSPSTPVYHHHLNLQTSTNAGTAGEQVWFITTGQYAGTPG